MRVGQIDRRAISIAPYKVKIRIFRYEQILVYI